jgi:hypothetical protein
MRESIMQPRQDIQAGTVLRADFYWKNEPVADGKPRNCVVVAKIGRKAIISPITSLSKKNPQNCRRIDDRLKRNIDRLDDEKDSWINLAEQNVVYLDGPRFHRNNQSRGGDSRIHGQLPAKMAEQLTKDAVALKVKPAKKQIESDWKEDVLKLKGRDAMADIKSNADISTPSMEDRVKAAAKARYDRMMEQKAKQKIARPKLGVPSEEPER